MATAMLGYKYLIGYNIRHEYEQKLKQRHLAADGEQSGGGGDGGGINPDEEGGEGEEGDEGEEGEEDDDSSPNSKCFFFGWCVCGWFVWSLMLVRCSFLFFLFWGCCSCLFSIAIWCHGCRSSLWFRTN